MPYILSRQE
jgi:TAP42-like family